jgi:hypothetical protein
MMVGLDTERNGAVLFSGEPARSQALARIAAIAERGNSRKEVVHHSHERDSP